MDWVSRILGEAAVGPKRDEIDHLKKVISDVYASSESARNFAQNLSMALTKILGIYVRVRTVYPAQPAGGNAYFGLSPKPDSYAEIPFSGFAQWGPPPMISLDIPEDYSEKDHESLVSILVHELVHIEQYKRQRAKGSDPQSVFSAQKNRHTKGKSVFKVRSPASDPVGYYNSKVELMPRAKEYVDALRRSGMSTSEILNTLKKGLPRENVTHRGVHRGAFYDVRNPESIRRFLKYAADYAQQSG